MKRSSIPKRDGTTISDGIKIIDLTADVSTKDRKKLIDISEEEDPADQILYTEITSSKLGKRKNYCFTFNNYTVENEKCLQTWTEKHCTYAIYGHETAPTTGTPHLQGYFSLIRERSLSNVQNKLKKVGIKMALFKALGTPKQNFNYCTKSDPSNFWQYGKLKNTGQGSRSDLAIVSEELRTSSVQIVAEQHPTEFIKYHRGINELKKVYDKSRTQDERDVITSVYYGDSGTGKTRRAHDEAKTLGIELYSLPNPNNGSVWFDSYAGEEGLLIDDFYGWIKPHDIFKWLDRYRVQVPTKGAFVYAQWTRVWITSNKAPEQWYKDGVLSIEMHNALNRRLTNIYEFRFSSIYRVNVDIKPIKEDNKFIETKTDDSTDLFAYSPNDDDSMHCWQDEDEIARRCDVTTWQK